MSFNKYTDTEFALVVRDPSSTEKLEATFLLSTQKVEGSGVHGVCDSTLRGKKVLKGDVKITGTKTPNVRRLAVIAGVGLRSDPLL